VTTQPPDTTAPPTETTQPPETTDPTTPTEPPTTPGPSGLSISAIGPVCLRDAPYIEVTFGNQPEFNGRPAAITFIDLDGSSVGTDTATYQAGSTVRFVYPGASVDGAGNPTDWPGWMLVDGHWVVDPPDGNRNGELSAGDGGVRQPTDDARPGSQHYCPCPSRPTAPDWRFDRCAGDGRRSLPAGRRRGDLRHPSLGGERLIGGPQRRQ
jgi:hypothetical protein